MARILSISAEISGVLAQPLSSSAAIKRALPAGMRIDYIVGHHMRKALHFPLALAVVAAAAIPAVATNSEDARILHALDRLTFGARPADLEQVRAMGLKKWIDLQLNPKKIPENPVL